MLVPLRPISVAVLTKSFSTQGDFANGTHYTFLISYHAVHLHVLHRCSSSTGLPPRAELGSKPPPEALFMDQIVRVLTDAPMVWSRP